MTLLRVSRNSRKTT